MPLRTMNCTDDLFERINVFLFILDEAGAIVDINAAVTRRLGYSWEETTGKSWDASVLCRCDAAKFDDIKAALESGIRFRAGAKFIAKAGGELSCLLTAARAMTGGAWHFFITAVDVTAVLESEAAAKKLFERQSLISEISRKLNTAQNYGQVLNGIVEKLGRFAGVSRVCIFEDIRNGAAARNTFEWCADGIEPQIDLLQEVPYDSIPSWRKLLQNEGRIVSKDTRKLPVDISALFEKLKIPSILAYPLTVQGEMRGFICFDECIRNREWPEEETGLLRDAAAIISHFIERRAFTSKLRENAMRLKMAMESAQEGLWDWNVATGEVYFNQAWCEMLGYERNEIEPSVKSWEKLVHPGDMPGVEAVLKKHLDGETEYYETIHRMKNKYGGWKWVLDHGKVIERDAAGKPLRAIGTHIDVTRQKETESMLEEVIATRDKLFSIISHDLRGPIGSLTQALEIVTGNPDMDEKTQAGLLRDLLESSRNAYQLLENLLGWSQSQRNALNIKRSVFPVGRAVEAATGVLGGAAAKKNITITCLDNEHFVLADLEMIKIVIRNLLSNAIKFTPDGGSVTISSRLSGESVEVSVADSGVGIPKEIFENLFKPNVFTTTYGTRDEKGSGLGLNLCCDLVERCGGKIRAETAIGKGSVFTISLPACKG